MREDYEEEVGHVGVCVQVTVDCPGEDAGEDKKAEARRKGCDDDYFGVVGHHQAADQDCGHERENDLGYAVDYRDDDPAG